MKKRSGPAQFWPMFWNTPRHAICAPPSCRFAAANGKQASGRARRDAARGGAEDERRCRFVSGRFVREGTRPGTDATTDHATKKVQQVEQVTHTKREKRAREPERRPATTTGGAATATRRRKDIDRATTATDLRDALALGGADVVGDDERVLAAELEHDGRQRRGGRAHHVHSDLGERGGRARPTKRCASLCSCFHSIALHRITLHLSPPNQLGRASDDELLDASRNFFHDGM